MLSTGAGVNSYSNERGIEKIDIEYGTDPSSSGGFFHADYKKHDDLKQMLDSNKDSLKLEAMKRIIGMIAKGRDSSELFPAVVKNVVSKNIEVKKLVYVYLVRYAEEQQDLALLSISTFQRALKDPNQLIRAGALRVLSSIRVSMIVPIVMLAIRDSAQDMSPYVRKTAAHAIPKLYGLDPEQKDELISVIEKLLSDRTTLVVGSAAMAFEEVCPERVDLIHKNYRKLCNLMVDVDEWGQVIIINMLTRYARTQFKDPNEFDVESIEPNKPFYDETSSESDSSTTTTKTKQISRNSTVTLDSDHRLLLRQTKPLLLSRNASVVMTVAQLYHHIAPRSEVTCVAKALIRLLRSHREVQSVVLTCIASMSIQRKSIFDFYMKSFFVRTSDPTHIKLLKLEILTNLASETNISIILREFQTYISSNDKAFVAATIQAIGRCAAQIKEVTDTCLSGLVHLLSNRDEYVVAESVVVIKELLQTQVTEHRDIISQMAKLLDFITISAARASILWLIGEYSERVPKIAPDVLRKLAKTFIDEEDIVKLQVLNLAVKLYLTNSSQTELLCQYIFSLARYDQNYDIRDRARFLKQFIFPATGEPSVLSENAKKVFLAKKPAPTLESKHKGREKYQLGSLSHYLNMRATGYHDLPDFPDIAPDSSVRCVESPPDIQNVDQSFVTTTAAAAKKSSHSSKKSSKVDKSKNRSFYSESEKSSSEYSSSDDDDDDDSSSSESETKSLNGEKLIKPETTKTHEKISSGDESDDSESDSDSSSSGSSSGDDSDDDDSSESEVNETAKIVVIQNKNTKVKESAPKSNLDLLLDLDDFSTGGSSIMTPSLGGFLTPLNIQNSSFSDGIELVAPSYIPLNSNELLNKISGYGLGVTYRFTRAPHLFSSNMISIELVFTNNGNGDLQDISVGKKILPPGMLINDFAPIGFLGMKSTNFGTLGIDMNDSSQPINFEIKSKAGVSNITFKAPIGELIRSVTMSETIFKIERAKLRGMTEHTASVLRTNGHGDVGCLQQRIYETANVKSILSGEENVLNFAGQTMSSKSLVLITILINDSQVTVTVNCDKIVVGSMLLNEIKIAFKN